MSLVIAARPSPDGHDVDRRMIDSERLEADHLRVHPLASSEEPA